MLKPKVFSVDAMNFFKNHNIDSTSINNLLLQEMLIFSKVKRI